MPRQIDGEPFQRISVDEAAELHGSDDVPLSLIHILTLPTILLV